MKIKKTKITKIRYFVSSLVHFILPSQCDFCFIELKGNDYQRICLNCLKKILKQSQQLEKNKCSICYAAQEIKNSFDKENICQDCLKNSFVFQKNLSLFFYDQLGKKLMTHYKIEKHHSYASVIADLLFKKYHSFFSKIDFILPVILLKKDLFERDFCPVWQVSKILQKKYNLPILKNSFVKNKKYKKPSQHFKNKEQRIAEIEGKYIYNHQYQNYFNNKKVAIIDDVFTTGSTMNSIAKLIDKNNNDTTIYSVSFARAVLK